MSGINSVLYNKKENTLETMLTREDIMEQLHITDTHTFYNLIHKQHLPHLKVGKKTLIPLSKYEKWLEKMVV